MAKLRMLEMGAVVMGRAIAFAFPPGNLPLDFSRPHVKLIPLRPEKR
jgi:hypothetical protein